MALTDLGPYTCQAYNGGGSPASHSVVMQVYGPVYPAPGEQKYMRCVAHRTAPFHATPGTWWRGPRRPAAPPPAPGSTAPPAHQAGTTARPPHPPPRYLSRLPKYFLFDFYNLPLQRPRARAITVKIEMPKNRVTKYQPNSNVALPCQVSSGLRWGCSSLSTSLLLLPLLSFFLPFSLSQTPHRPTVKWLKDGVKVRESSRLRTDRSNHTLSITQAQPQDSGRWGNLQEYGTQLHIEL